MMTSEEAAAAILQDYQARYGRPSTEPVEAGRVRDYLEALGEAGEWPVTKPVPALFILTLGRTRRPQPGKGGAVNAGESFQFHEPVHIGDTITVTRRVTGVEERQGKRGRMFLTKAEATYTNQHGTLVARQSQNTLRWGW